MKLNSGQSLFELVMAIGVSALIIVVLVSLVNNALQNATFSRNETVAARYAQAGTEWLRAQRDNRIDVFMTNATSAPRSWCLKDESLSDTSWNKHSSCGSGDTVGTTIFTRQVDFSTATVSGKTIIIANVKVNWTDSKGTHNVNSATQYSDWRQR